MPLITTQNVPLIADKDIKVYKFIGYRDDIFGRRHYCSTQNKKYEYHLGLNTPENRKNPSMPYKSYDIFYEGCYELENDGWLFSFTTFPEILEGILECTTYDELEKVKKTSHRSFVEGAVVEMIIPKGAKYFVDIYNTKICSDMLVWNR